MKNLESLPVVGDLTRSYFLYYNNSIARKRNRRTEGLVNGNDHGTREAEWLVGDMRDGESRYLPC